MLVLIDKRNSIVSATSLDTVKTQPTQTNNAESLAFIRDQTLCNLRTVPDAYYVVSDPNQKVPDGCKATTSFFRIPSNFFNADFYTIQKEPFEDDAAKPFAELHKKN